MKDNENIDIASTEQLQQELNRIRFNSRYLNLLRSTVYVLVIVAAVSVLVASLILPVLQIYGDSMTPTLEDGDIVVSVRKGTYSRGEVAGMYYANRVLVKRIIAIESDIVDLDENGVFTVNGVPVDEPYIQEKHYGDATDIEFPFQVPEGSFFVVGDNRQGSVDSRSKTVGCISSEDIVGQIIFTVWPLNSFGIVR